MDAVREDVTDLILKEYESANKKFPMFHSNHEAHGVIREEIEEAEEEFKEAKNQLEWIWKYTKDNESMKVAIASDKAFGHMHNAIVEMIQAAAMLYKTIESIKQWE